MKLFLQNSKAICVFALTIFLSLGNITYSQVVITQQPLDQINCVGNTISLTAVATSTNPVSYAWKHGGVVVDTNSPVYTKAMATIADSGTYWLEITDLVTNTVVKSDYAKVTINQNPSISMPLSGTTSVCQSGSIALSFSVTNYSNLVWYRNGMNVKIGDTFYNKTSATFADSGKYNVLIKALPGCTDMYTNSLNIKVDSPVTIITQPVGTNLISGIGMQYTMRVAATGKGPYTYQWYRNNLPIFGAVSDSFKIVSYVSQFDSGVYYCEVTGASPCNTTIQSKKAVIGSTNCPIITMQPDSVVFGCVGSSFSLEVKAVGAGGYQWIKNGSPLSGAIYPRYTVIDATGDETGFYVLNVLPRAGFVCPQTNSRTVKLTILPKPKFKVQPMINESCEATTHTMIVAAENATRYQWYVNGVASPGDTMKTMTISNVSTTPKTVYVEASSVSCSAVQSNTILVRQMDPNYLAGVNYNNNYRLIPTCTDANGWQYYVDSSNLYKILFAIRKNRNIATFRPDIYTTGGVIKEIAPNNIQREGILMGMRMYNLNLDSGSRITEPYDVKFYYSREEVNQLLSRVGTIKESIGRDYFQSNLKDDILTVITSTQVPMNPTLINNASYPLNFDNAICNDYSFGLENAVSYIQINKLFMSKGGGTYYYSYTDNRPKSASIQNGSQGEFAVVYPNPTSNEVKITTNSKNKGFDISIFNLMGQEIISKHSDKNSTIINVSSLPKGNYLVKINSNDEVQNTKLTIE